MSSWSSLRGQERVKQLLRNQLAQSSTSHAYLFIGATNTGKDLAARLFAQALNCLGPEPPCGVCSSCLKAVRESHPDIRMIKPDGASIKLEQIKSLLAEAKMTPNEGKFRVYLINRAELLSGVAANALLLSLEEPPPQVVFVLVSSAPLLPTIMSRCQILQFSSAADGQQASAQAFESDELRVDDVVKLIGDLLEAPDSERLNYIEQLDKAGVDYAILAERLLSLHRDWVVWNLTGRQDLLQNRNGVSLLAQQSRQPSVWRAARLCGELYEVQRLLAQNVNKRLLMEKVFLSI